MNHNSRWNLDQFMTSKRNKIDFKERRLEALSRLNWSQRIHRGHKGFGAEFLTISALLNIMDWVIEVLSISASDFVVEISVVCFDWVSKLIIFSVYSGICLGHVGIILNDIDQVISFWDLRVWLTVWNKRRVISAHVNAHTF